jgi:pyruvate formate lyase activating enzyme
VHTCLDTSGILFRRDAEYLARIDRLLAATDLVMLDIKHMDEEAHKRLTGHSNRSVLDFATYLNEKRVPTRIRHVIVPGYTDNEAEWRMLGRFLADFDCLEKVETLPYHTLGKAKYENLGIAYPMGDAPQLTEREAAAALSVIKAEMAAK